MSELEDLARRLAALEEENRRLAAEVAAMRVAPRPGDRQDPDVSRRGLLRRFGAVTVAGAGAAVGSALLAASPAAAGVDGDVVLGGNNNSGTASTTIDSTSPDGTMFAVNGATTGSNAVGLQGAITNPGNQSPALWGSTTGTGAGVQGSASGQGVGLRGLGGRAQLWLAPAGGPAGAPTTGTHNTGEVFVDSAGVFWICVAGGPPASWRRMTLAAAGYAARSGSVNFLNGPVRLLDTRTSAIVGAGETRVVQVSGANAIPTGAVGVIGNLAVTATENSSGSGGYLTVYPTGLTPPLASNINWFGANQNLSNMVAVRLSAGGAMTIHNGVAGGSSATRRVRRRRLRAVGRQRRAWSSTSANAAAQSA